MSSPEEAAEWMYDEVQERHSLDHNAAAMGLDEEFGSEEYTYLNEHGNTAIDQKVLSAFREISEGKVVWERGLNVWRERMDHDPPGRQV